jgi:uncharacterized membrane protein SirB2
MVTLFLILYVVKFILLFANKNEALNKLRSKTKVPEMIISTLFLVTGIYLTVTAGNGILGTWFYIKIALVIGALVTGVIAFKKQSKPLAVVMLLSLLYVYGISETKSLGMKKADISKQVEGAQSGAAIFEKANCVGCHGADGNAGLGGAKPLGLSTLTPEEIKAIVTNGKNSMPAHKLESAQLDSVVSYVLSMRK